MHAPGHRYRSSYIAYGTLDPRADAGLLGGALPDVVPVGAGLGAEAGRQGSGRAAGVDTAGCAVGIDRPGSSADGAGRLGLRVGEIGVDQTMEHGDQPLLGMTLQIGAVGKRLLGQPTVGKSWLPLAQSLLPPTTSGERRLEKTPVLPGFLELIDRTDQRLRILGKLLRHPSPDDQVMPGGAKPVQGEMK